MRVFITGGAGFIGSHLAHHHLGKGDQVVVLDDLSTGNEDNTAALQGNPLFRFERGDVLSWWGLEREIVHAERIYHMAAVVGMFRVLQQPVEVTRVNVWGTERILECVAKANHRAQVVVASSSSVYGFSDAPELKEDLNLVFAPDLNGAEGYALSKLINEFQAAAYRKAHEISVCIPRFFNAVGPRQCGSYGFVLPRFIKQAVSGKPLTVFGDGSQTRSFCDVRDTIAAVDKLAGNSSAWGEVVNIGSPEEISILDLAQLVIDRANSESQITFVPFDKGYGGVHFRHIMQRHPSLEKLKRLTDFQPSWNLVKTIDDLLERECLAQK
jgi:UDP-glucose 4-epimerase